MFNIRDLRRRSRSALHQAMRVPALYTAPDGANAPVACSVRVHNRQLPFGDMTGLDFQPAERRETVPEIISLNSEITPARGGVFSIQAGEAYRIETPLPVDGLTRTSQCVRLSPGEAAGYPPPETT